MNKGGGEKMTYPVTEYLKARFQEDDVRGELVDKAVEFVGEVEHDPSLLWPGEYAHVSTMTDTEVDNMTIRLNGRIAEVADHVFEFVGYAVA